MSATHEQPDAGGRPASSPAVRLRNAGFAGPGAGGEFIREEPIAPGIMAELVANGMVEGSPGPWVLGIYVHVEGETRPDAPLCDLTFKSLDALLSSLGEGE